MTSPTDSLYGFFDDFRGGDRARDLEMEEDGIITTEAKTVITVIVPRDQMNSECSGVDGHDSFYELEKDRCADAEFDDSREYNEVNSEDSASEDDTAEEVSRASKNSSEILESAMRDMVVVEMEHASPKSYQHIEYASDDDDSRGSAASVYSYSDVSDQETGYTPTSPYGSIDGVSESPFLDNQTDENSENLKTLQVESLRQQEVHYPEPRNRFRIVQSSIPYHITERKGGIEKSASICQTEDREQTNSKQKKGFRHQAQREGTDTAVDVIRDDDKSSENQKIQVSSTYRQNQQQNYTKNFATTNNLRELEKVRESIRFPKVGKPFMLNNRPVLPLVVRVPCDHVHDVPNVLTPVASVIPQPVVNLHLPRPDKLCDNGPTPRRQPRFKPDIPHQLQAAACYHDGKMAVSILGDQSLLHSSREPLNLSITFINKLPSSKATKRQSDSQKRGNKRVTSSNNDVNIYGADCTRVSKKSTKSKGRQLPPLRSTAQIPTFDGKYYNTEFKQWIENKKNRKGNTVADNLKKSDKCKASKGGHSYAKMNRHIVEQRAMLPPFNTHLNPEASARHQRIMTSVNFVQKGDL